MKKYIASRYLLPLVMSLGFLGAYAVQKAWTQPTRPFNSIYKPHWDINIYNHIAQVGYERGICQDDHSMNCGTLAWFPTWPLLNHTLVALTPGLSMDPCISCLAPTLVGMLLLFLMYRLCLRHGTHANGALACAALLALPGSFYFLTGFPYALLALLQIVYLWQEDTWDTGPPQTARRILRATIAFAISLTYPTGALFCVAACGLSLSSAQGRKITRQGRILALFERAAPFALGPLCLATYHLIAFHDFFSILHSEAKFQRHFSNPLTLVSEAFKIAYSQWQALCAATNIRQFGVCVAAVVMFGVLLALALVLSNHRRKWALGAFCLTVYLFSPATGSLEATYRQYLVMAVPLALLIGQARRRWLLFAALAACAWWSAKVMLPLYLANGLV